MMYQEGGNSNFRLDLYNACMGDDLCECTAVSQCDMQPTVDIILAWLHSGSSKGANSTTKAVSWCLKLRSQIHFHSGYGLIERRVGALSEDVLLHVNLQ
jgi:hypothetical protein